MVSLTTTNNSPPSLDPHSLKRFLKNLISQDNFCTEDFFRQSHGYGVKAIREALQMIEEELQAELTQLVGREFEGFAKLFNEIGDVGREDFGRLREKLLFLRDSAQMSLENAQTEMVKMQNYMEKIRNNHVKIKSLKLIDQLEQDLNRLRKMISFISDDHTLCLAAELFFRIQSYINKTSGKLEYPSEILQTWGDLTGQFYSQLEDLVSTCIREKEIKLWQVILKIYARLGKVEMVTNVFLEEFYSNALKDITLRIHKANCTTENVINLFNLLLQLITTVKKEYFNQATEYDLTFIEVILGYTFATIVKDLQFIFSPALPDVFRTNFRSSCSFLDTLSCVLTKQQIKELDSNEHFQSYTRSWQLNVYYQLRYRDITQVVEAALNSLQSPRICEGEMESHPVITILTNVCRDLSSDKIQLSPLRPRFLRLRLYAISRVSQFLIDNAEGNSKVSNILHLHKQVIDLVINIESSLENDILCEGSDIDKIRLLHTRFLAHIRHRHEKLEEQLERNIFSILTKTIEAISLDMKASPQFSHSLNEWINLNKNSAIEAITLTKGLSMALDQFLATLDSVVVQSRKSVKNYLRVKSIMKEETTEDEVESPLAQQTKLFSILAEELNSTLDIIRNEFGEESKEYIKINEALQSLNISKEWNLE